MYGHDYTANLVLWSDIFLHLGGNNNTVKLTPVIWQHELLIDVQACTLNKVCILW